MKGYRESGAGAWNGEVGPYLRKAREGRGISLKEAERHTRIRWRYLEGLEREDPGELPDRSYIQGFLGSYAEFLGLDVEKLVHSLKRYDKGYKRRVPRRDKRGGQRSSPASEPDAEGDREAESAGHRRRLHGGARIVTSLIVLAIGLVVASFYLVQDETVLSGSPADGGETPVDTPGANPPRAVTTPAPTLEEGADDTAPVSSGRMRARVIVRGSESWISVESDSEIEYTGIAQPGFSQIFESSGEFRITTGNAGAVELRINGLDYGTLGESGEVTSKRFTLKRER